MPWQRFCADTFMKLSPTQAIRLPNKRLSLTCFVLLFFTLQVLPCSVAAASPSKCARAAEDWINALPHLEKSKRERLKNYTRDNCSFAAKWQQKLENISGRQRQRRTCNDLVLIWTHKECIYYRDYVTAAAYNPCKSWSRHMFRRCMAGDIDWFLAH